MIQPARVLTVGPSPDLPGGMSTVIGQMLKLDFFGQFEMGFFPITLATSSNERRAARIARHISQRFELGRTLEAKRTAIVHLHTCSGFSFHRSAWDLRVARRHGCRTILHMHGARFDEYFSSARRLEQRFIRLGLESADRVIALSNGWAEKVHVMAPAARIVVVENAVESLSQPVRRTGNAHCRFLTLSRMDTWKGIDDLLDACGLLQRQGIEFLLTLAGPEGSAGNRAQIQDKIAKRGLTEQVHFVGPVAGEEKSRLFQQADVYVQPSHHEGMPISILEACASGLPVVATRVGAVPELIEDQVQGLTVSAHDPAALARAMGLLAIDIPRRQTLGLAGLELTRSRFSLLRFRDDLLNVYKDLMQETAEPSYRRKLAAAPAC